MKRLVYSPKAYAYVRRDDGSIFNLSPYIMEGMVDRRVNMVSTAELTIRNPDMIFTKGSRDKDGPFFKPMDGITIWLERIRGYPVQVFSGYLDDSPYLQLYPGPTKLSASCTLKRLLHTYWDPALQFTQSFMYKYGWVNEDGQLRNKAAENNASEGKTADQRQSQILQDGSIGQLLFAVLTEVADWPEKAIHIERLPDKLIQTVTEVYLAYNADAKMVKAEVEELLKNYIGTAELGSSSFSDGDHSTGDIKGAENIVPVMVKIANEYGVPPALVVTTGIIETNLGQHPSAHRDGGEKYQGWFQWEPFAKGGAPGSYGAGGVSGLDYDKRFDLGYATAGYCQAAVGHAKKDPSLRNDIRKWAQHIQGVQFNLGGNPRFDSGWPAFETQAKDLISKYGDREASSSGNSTDTKGRGSGDQQTGDSETAGGLSKPLNSAMSVTSPYGPRSSGFHNGIDLQSAYGDPWFSAVDGEVVAVDNGGWSGASGCVVIKPKPAIDNYPGVHLGYGGTSKVLVGVGDTVQAGDKIALGGTHGSGPHLHFFLNRSGTASNGDQDPTEFVEAAFKGKTPTGGDPTDGSGGTSGGANAEGVLTAAKAAAFVQAIEFPSFMEQQEAMRLTGAKSLLNDKPLYPFVEELSKAAMRSFQSLPNGDFYAFYPDYFGHLGNRAPYWYVDDLEVLDAQISLTDESLATHVFAVGDVTAGVPNGRGIDWFDRLQSTGVVNIMNVMMAGFSPAGDVKKNRDKDPGGSKPGRVATNPTEVIDFLKRYGARPYVLEAPFVRSPFFEAFLAWQEFNLLWSRQFATEVQFTFMPEVFPGGLLGFKQHDLQVYVDAVQHTFSYTDGFTTTVEVSAPAQLSMAGNADDPLSFGLVSAASA